MPTKNVQAINRDGLEVSAFHLRTCKSTSCLNWAFALCPTRKGTAKKDPDFLSMSFFNGPISEVPFS